MLNGNTPLSAIVDTHEQMINFARGQLAALEGGTSRPHSILQTSLAESTRQAIIKDIEGQKTQFGGMIRVQEERLLKYLLERSLLGFPEDPECEEEVDVIDLLGQDNSESSIKATPGGLFKITSYYWNSNIRYEIGEGETIDPAAFVFDLRLSNQTWKSQSRDFVHREAFFKSEFAAILDLCSRLGAVLPSGMDIVLCFPCGDTFFRWISELESNPLQNAVVENSSSHPHHTDERWHMLRNRIIISKMRTGEFLPLPVGDNTKIYNPEEAKNMRVNLVIMRFKH